MAHHYRYGDRNPQTDALRNPDRRRRGGPGLVDARVICGILQASRVVLHHRHGGFAPGRDGGHAGPDHVAFSARILAAVGGIRFPVRDPAALSPYGWARAALAGPRLGLR